MLRGITLFATALLVASGADANNFHFKVANNEAQSESGAAPPAASQGGDSASQAMTSGTSSHGGTSGTSSHGGTSGTASHGGTSGTASHGGTSGTASQGQASGAGLTTPDHGGSSGGTVGASPNNAGPVGKIEGGADWMKAFRSYQARVQGDKPEWSNELKRWVSKYGDSTEDHYIQAMDTVNTASIEGALMYVQAEGINVQEQSVKCQRKNNMQYVVFYEMTIVQPKASMQFYADNAASLPEFCPFVAMDSAKCTDEGSNLPEECKQYYGLDGEKDLGPCVGAQLKQSDPRAPYPNNYWFSFPNSCAQKDRSDKTPECRKKYPGGLCPVGKVPDGKECTFSYEIMGYINIDDIVGITKMKDSSGNYYKNYKEFCEDGGVEFNATNDNGFKVHESIKFWKDPGKKAANAHRAETMVELYNEKAQKEPKFKALPEVEKVADANPPCYENSKKCADSKTGCGRALYASLCMECKSGGSDHGDCKIAPEDYEYNMGSDSGSYGGFGSAAGGNGGSDTEGGSDGAHTQGENGACRAIMGATALLAFAAMLM